MCVELIRSQHRIHTGKIVDERAPFNDLAVMQKIYLASMIGSIVQVDGGRPVDV